MGLESATFINGLVDTNPTASDNTNQGDNHIRLIKSTLKATFPGITGAVTVTHSDINSVTGKLDKTGGTMTGALAGTSATYSGTVTATGGFVGNASTATALQTARTINGVAFNGTSNISFGTDAVAEGAVNLYFTNSRARAAISATGGIAYDPVTGVISFSPTGGTPGSVSSVNGLSGAVVLTTSNITEGSRLYYTDARARSSISAAGSLTYNAATGVMSFNDAVTSVAGKTGAVSLSTGDISGLQTALDGRASLSGSYADPSWITALAASKLTGAMAVANGGTGATSAATAFANIAVAAQALTGNGYLKLQNGLHLIWGSATVSGNTSTTISYPAGVSLSSFSVAVASGAVSSANAQDNNPGVTACSTTGFTVYNANGNQQTVFYIAVGI